MATETVAVMFTDLVGSTALLSEVGEEAAEALRREHFSLLRAAVEPCRGREVKNLGDGLMVAFPSAADAVTAAVAVQRAFERRNRVSEHALVVRVGLSVGDADVEDGDFFGVPVVEAARLCAKCEGGEIVATELVRLLAGSRGGFVFESLGDLDLKGLEQPVSSHRVAWQPEEDVDERPSLPTRLAASVPSAFVGRDAELEHLMSAWKAADGGEHRVVLLSGEPGIGKTTLAAAFAADVHADGATVVYGRCDEDLGIPYQAWIEALSQLVVNAPQAVLDDHLAESGAGIARLVPELARRVPMERRAHGDAENERFVVFGCVTDLLSRMSAERPVLVVLDDLHWADRPTLQLLRHVLTCDRKMRVEVLGTFRDSEVTTEHPMAELLAAMHREQGADRIALRGLSDDDLLALLERIAGHEMSEEGVALRDAVLAETGGNPFFVGEILRHLAETGTIYQRDDGRWVATVDLRAAGLPVSVREVIGRRLSVLGRDAERVLTLGAVIGRDFEVPLLAAVAHVNEDDLIDMCDAAVAAAILDTTEDPNRYTFAHALIEHTLYDRLSPARRARAHHSVAEHLEANLGDEPGERAGELAHHWAAAVQPSDMSKAVHYAAVAGRRALEYLAPDEALRWYTEALELLDRGGGGDDRQRAEILVGLGDAQRQCGIAAHRETLLEAAWLADRIDAVDLLVRAALTNSRGITSLIGNVDQERVAVIDRALALLDDGADPDRGRLLALAAIEHVYDTAIDERIAWADEAVATSRRSGHSAALCATLRHATYATIAPWTLDQRLAWSTEACALAEALGDPVAQYWAENQRMIDSLEAADVDTMRRCHARSEHLAQRIPSGAIQWAVAITRAVPALLAGELAEAERLAEAAFAYGTEAGQPDPMTVFGGTFVNVRHHQGRFGELLSLLEQLVVDIPGLPVYGAVLTAAYALEGQPERARARLAQNRATDFTMPADLAWSTAHVLWAEAAFHVADTDTAAVIKARLAPFAHLVPFTGVSVLPAIAHYVGRLDHLLGRLDDADRWFEQATVIHRRFESPLLMAYTEAAWAALLADRARGDDHARARELAERALAAATAGGYGYIERDARAALDRLT